MLLNIAERIEKLKKNNKTDQHRKLSFEIPENHILQLDNGPDFDVFNIIPVRKISDTSYSKAIVYAGHHPSWFYKDYGFSQDENFIIKGEFIGEKVTWYYFENHEEKALLREKITHAFIGVTSADFCLADSATLVMKTRPGQARSVSLAPSIHVVVISLEQIIADLNELYAFLKYDTVHQKEGLTRCMTFITGPSKTADIEAIMVHGVHGPREVHLYVITE